MSPPPTFILKEQKSGFRDIVDKCLFARYSTRGRLTSDTTFQEDRERKGRGQTLLDQLSQGLGPAAPLRPDEIAVTMKLPKRRLPPPKMPTPI